MRKKKEKTAVDKAVDLLFESGVDGTAIMGQGGLLKELTKGILERALTKTLTTIITPKNQPSRQRRSLDLN